MDQMRRAAAERVPRVTIFTNFLLVIRGVFFRTAMRSPLNSLYNLHKAETQQLWDGDGDKNSKGHFLLGLREAQAEGA